MALILDSMGNVVGDDGADTGSPYGDLTASTIDANVNYYGDKIADFQAAYDALQAQRAVLYILQPAVADDPSAYAEWADIVGQVESQLQTADTWASVINLGGALGLPTVRQGLGLIQVPAALVALGGIAALTLVISSMWAVKRATDSYFADKQAARDAIIAHPELSTALNQQENSGFLSSVSNIMQLAIFGAIAYFVTKSVKKGN